MYRQSLPLPYSCTVDVIVPCSMIYSVQYVTVDDCVDGAGRDHKARASVVHDVGLQVQVHLLAGLLHSP